jgi:hypothetical protein
MTDIGNVDEAKRIRAEQMSAIVGRFSYDPEAPWERHTLPSRFGINQMRLVDGN